MTEVKKDTFKSQGKRVCDNDDMVRVVLDMTKMEYYKHLKPILETSHNSEYVAKAKSCPQCGSENILFNEKHNHYGCLKCCYEWA